jgi:hypothetical protein
MSLKIGSQGSIYVLKIGDLEIGEQRQMRETGNAANLASTSRYSGFSENLSKYGAPKQ